MSNEIFYDSNFKEHTENTSKLIKKIKYGFINHNLCNYSLNLINSFEEYKCGFKTDKEIANECTNYISLLNIMKENYLKV